MILKSIYKVLSFVLKAHIRLSICIFSMGYY